MPCWPSRAPLALHILQSLTAVDLAAMKYYWFAHGEVAGIRGTISRTGYTGEDGFEIFVPPQSADRLWLALLDAGNEAGLIPAGLGARDTLRLEAAMRLYGNDIDDDDDGARRRPRLDRGLEQERSSSARPCCARSANMASSASWSASR